MKIRISATINENSSKILDSLLMDGEFRNKSHIIEKGIELVMEMKNEKK